MSTTIEATCTACGTINRVGEADVPPGAKFVPCVSCKSRVALPPIKASRATPPPSPGGASSFGLADLPAPKRGPALPSEPSRPAPRSGLAAAQADLPAPRGARPAPASVAPPAAGNFDLDDLMPGGVDLAELPAPKGPGGRNMDVTDLPAPRASNSGPIKSRAMTDLPVPGVTDLPAPAQRGSARPMAMPSIADLPTPKAGITDLPTPRGPSNVSDLPAPVAKGGPPQRPAMPKNVANLPAPKAGISGLPTPKPGGPTDLLTPKDVSDVPAPKGFFDDLPQPARNQSQNTKPDLPAPKGFFEDLPGRVNSNKPEVPAPKGFFDDLPGRVNQHGRAPEKPEVPAPKGFFDDLPQPAQAGRPSPPAPKNAPVELNMDSGMLDLGLAEPSHAGPVPGKFDNLDLNSPGGASAAPQQEHAAGGINFAPPRAKADSIQPLPPVRQRGNQQPQTIELEEPRPTALPSQKLGPRSREKRVSIDPAADARRAKRMRIFALVGLLVVGLGAGGFYFYRRWAAKKAVQNTINEQLAAAKTALASSDPGHWARATEAVHQVLELDNQNVEAMALGSESLLASALATGINMPGKFGEARGYLQKAVSGTVGGAALTRARGLNAISQNDGEAALNFLKPLADGKDPQASLYVGWAFATHGETEPAIKAFDGAIAGQGEIRLYGLYGRANTKLSTGDITGADADFKAILAMNRDFVPAMIGQAAAYPATKSQEQEKDLEAILVGRKDIGEADPRAVVRAWILTAEVAKRGNRLDAARDRYRKALALITDDVGAISGLADVELRDGKLDAAAEQIKHALDISKDDIRAQIVQSDISILRKDYPDAKERLKALAAKNPPPPPTDLARIKLAQGHLAEATADDEAAVEFYKDAAKLAGDTDLAPTLAAVEMLGKLADKAVDNAKAVELRSEANKLLAALEAGAEKDPQTALTLGMAYLRTNDPAKAEPWLRKFADARPDEAEGQYQLAKALARQGQTDDAINRLIKAQGLAPTRAEIGIELAVTYERAGKDDKAGELYEKLLKEKDPGIELRYHAGRYYARKGDIDKAAEQGKLILAQAPKHNGGMYLKGEGELKNNRVDEARALFSTAANNERDPIYYDALGRAQAMKAVQSNGDPKLQQAAIEAFTVATNLDPKLVTSWIGIGEILVVQKQWARAIDPLGKAWELDKRNSFVAFLIGRSYMEQRAANPQLGPIAIKWLQQSLQLEPDSMFAHYQLAILYSEAPSGAMGKEAAAHFHAATTLVEKELKAGNKMIEVFPLADAYYFEGRAYFELNELPMAKRAWERFMQAVPKDRMKGNPYYDEVNRKMSAGLSDIKAAP